jgi:hypothetical protein
MIWYGEYALIKSGEDGMASNARAMIIHRAEDSKAARDLYRNIATPTEPKSIQIEGGHQANERTENTPIPSRLPIRFQLYETNLGRLSIKREVNWPNGMKLSILNTKIKAKNP